MVTTIFGPFYLENKISRLNKNVFPGSFFLYNPSFLHSFTYIFIGYFLQIICSLLNLVFYFKSYSLLNISTLIQTFLNFN